MQGNMDFQEKSIPLPIMTKSELQNVKMRFGIVGNSEALVRAIDVAVQVAPTNLSVLITGENGVGKEVFPQIIHQFSARKHGKYFAVNCGAIPAGTITSELFGHEKGAFTGADRDRKGYFAEADGGTIFLDEIAELPKETQSMLLRVLENHEYIRVGSSQVQKTDVRVIAATNVKLAEAVADGRFREDLFYRLNTIPISVPPLRERGNDIKLLFSHFATMIAQQYSMPPVQLDEEAKEVLSRYAWPGNVRQLKNVAEQISVIETKREITAGVLRMYLPQDGMTQNLPMLTQKAKPEGNASFENEREILYKVLFDLRRDVTEMKKVVNDLMQEREQAQTAAAPTTINVPAVKDSTVVAEEDEIQYTEAYVDEPLALDVLEKELITKALNRHKGKRKEAAQDLRISERTLYRKIKEYDLE